MEEAGEWGGRGMEEADEWRRQTNGGGRRMEEFAPTFSMAPRPHSVKMGEIFFNFHYPIPKRKVKLNL
jgi:hypothetical protein